MHPTWHDPTPATMCEDELIERARNGEVDAVRRLYESHAERVYTIVRRILADRANAEDVAQEVWVQAIRGLASFRGDSRFTTWLHRIAVNGALQRLRQRKRTAGREVPIPISLAYGRRAQDPLLAVRLERALSRIPDGMRTVLVLHDVEGFTHEEIGEMLGVAAGTSKSQLFKARAKMRTLLRPPHAVGNTDTDTEIENRHATPDTGDARASRR